jgi:hypothetical protein
MSHTADFTSSQEIILLAVEIEALDAAGALDSAMDDAVMRAIDRHGAVDASAGLLLTLFARRRAEMSGLLWERLPLPMRKGLVRPMFRIKPQIAVRSLGARNLYDCLALTADPALHDAIAAALSATFVADSELCLAVLLPQARDRLAFVLAERAGREADAVPDWIPQLPPQAHHRATLAFAFGVLLSGRQIPFDAVTAGFTEKDWEFLMAKAQERGIEIASSGSIDMLLSKAPASGRPRTPSIKRQPAQGPEQPTLTDSARASVIIASALAADAPALAELTAQAGRIAGPTWRREAQNAIFRRALAIGAHGFKAGLPHTEVGSAIIVHRLERGDTSVLRRRAWTAIRPDRRFTLLMELMGSIDDGSVTPTKARLGDVVTAILEMAGAMRDVLILHLVTHLSRHPAMSDAVLDRIAEMKAQWQDEILIALARIYALRGNLEKAREQMQFARSTSQDRQRDIAFERLVGLLDDASSVPLESVEAIVSTLATVSAPDLPAAMRLCFDRLPRHEIDFVVAEVISRGRAADAFPDLAM